MTWDTIRGLGGRRLALLIGFVLALGGCGQLAANQQPSAQPAPQQQPASIKLPPF
jgi:hypothetical protein